MSVNAAPSTYAALFERVSLGSLTLPNRIVMAPMTREFAVAGVLSAEAPAYYARRARGGAGLIITEGTAIPHPVAQQSRRIPHLYGDAALARWREVVDAVHAEGSRIFVQLWHCGLGRLNDETDNPEAPSIAPSAIGRRPVRAMTEADVAEVIAAFAGAASTAKHLGFDGVEIHGAHGYLLDQFLWTRTNRRGDRYGGDLLARTRFAAAVVAAIRASVGRFFPIMFRFSQWKGGHYDAKLVSSPQELEILLRPLADAGVDIFDASTRRFWLPEFAGSDLNLAAWAKKVSGRPSLTVGSVGLEGPLDGNYIGEMSATPVSIANLKELLRMLERGDFDLVALGRMLLCNPEWPARVRQGRFENLQSYDPARVALALEPADEAQRAAA
ncbi:MAG: putative oxidoreductase [Nevskia sp.]|nr:putative oxidoreductase [Nevskia sp.]